PSPRLHRSPAGRDRRPLPGEGDGVPPRPRGPRTARAAVPGVRQRGPADPVRGPRDGLLPGLPDGGEAARRPGALAAPARGLPPDPGGAGGAARDPEERGRRAGALRLPDVARSRSRGHYGRFIAFVGSRVAAVDDGESPFSPAVHPVAAPGRPGRSSTPPLRRGPGPPGGGAWPPARTPRSHRGERSGWMRRILVVDDDKQMVRTLCDILVRSEEHT